MRLFSKKEMKCTGERCCPVLVYLVFSSPFRLLAYYFSVKSLVYILQNRVVYAVTRDHHSFLKSNTNIIWAKGSNYKVLNLRTLKLLLQSQQNNLLSCMLAMRFGLSRWFMTLLLVILKQYLWELKFC